MFYLTGLQSLSLYLVDTGEVASRLGKCADISHLENLYLFADFASQCRFPDIEALITRPKALKNLVFYFHDDLRASAESIISNAEISDCLQNHTATLESIDICRNRFGDRHRYDSGHFDLLRSYTSLKHLRVNPGMPLGGCSASPQAPFRLKDTLPSTLQTLTLNEESCAVITDLPGQLQELMNGEFPFLKSIVREGLPASWIDGDSRNLNQPYQAVERACREKTFFTGSRRSKCCLEVA